MKDIVYDDTQTIGNGTGTHTITTADTGRMLGVGWLFYLASFLLNSLYYKLHPSGPEFCSWGKEEELEEWTPKENKDVESGTVIPLIYTRMG